MVTKLKVTFNKKSQRVNIVAWKFCKWSKIYNKEWVIHESVDGSLCKRPIIKSNYEDRKYIYDGPSNN